MPAGDWGDVRDTDEPIEEFENRPPRRLDRNNVPAEITPEMIDRLSFGDIRWLRTEANLTPEQRQSFDAAYQASSLGQLFAESGGRFREIWKQFQLDRKRGARRPGRRGQLHGDLYGRRLGFGDGERCDRSEHPDGERHGWQ